MKRAGLKDVLAGFIDELRRGNSAIAPSELDNVEREIRKRVDSERAPRLALIGDTGVGKSSTLNALFNAGQSVGHTTATTTAEFGMRIQIGTVQADRGELVVYDMPGLNESIATHEQHLQTYSRVLADVDVALWVLEAHHRPMEHVQMFLRNEMRQINADLVERVVFALNKVDLVHPGQTAWHPLANLPSQEQQENIEARIRDVQRLVLEALPAWRGTVIGYSAEKRYKLPQLFAVMMGAVAKKRQWILAEHKALADYLEYVDDSVLPEELKRDRPRTVPESGSGFPDPRETLLNMSEDEFQRLVEERRRRTEFS